MDAGNLHKKAMKIIEKYIKTDSEKQVNISASMQAEILKDFKDQNVNQSTFVSAEREIVHLLERDKFTAFKASPEFQRFLGATEAYSSPYSPRHGSGEIDDERSAIRRGGSVIGRRRTKGVIGGNRPNTWSPSRPARS